MKVFVGPSLVLLSLFLSSCGFTGGAQLFQGALTGALNGVAPVLTSSQILQQYTDYHNLKIGLQQIDQAPGMVGTLTAPPVVGTTLTPPAITPAPVPVSPVVTPIPTPVPSTNPAALP